MAEISECCGTFSGYERCHECAAEDSTAADLAQEIEYLKARLSNIADLAQSAIDHEPRDLEETWMRVRQIARKTP